MPEVKARGSSKSENADNGTGRGNRSHSGRPANNKRGTGMDGPKRRLAKRGKQSEDSSDEVSDVLSRRSSRRSPSPILSTSSDSASSSDSARSSDVAAPKASQKALIRRTRSKRTRRASVGSPTQNSSTVVDTKRRRLRSPPRQRLTRGPRRSYAEEESDSLSDASSSEEVGSGGSDGGGAESDPGGEVAVEKIFACRWRNPAAPLATPDGTSSAGGDTQLSSSYDDTSSALPDSHPNKEDGSSFAGRVMEYLVKFEGVSHRRLKWLTKEELEDQSHDTVDAKICNFHRRMTDGDTDKECSLLPSEAGNFLLYSKVDRVIAVRQVDESSSDPSSSTRKEYLVKWQLLGYSAATWESEEELCQSDDKRAIQRFIEINSCFEFPTCAPAPGVDMAGSPIDLRKGQTNKLHQPSGEFLPATESASVGETPEIPSSEAESLIGETFYSDVAIQRSEGTTRHWKMFLKRKLAADGTYIPSIRWDKETTGLTDKSGRKLMGHQQEGIKWLFYNTEINKHGSLLADEMGLGKTCQSIAFLEHLLDVKSAGSNAGCHALVVVQKTVLENWRREFDLWAPHLNVVPLTGGRRDREAILEYEKRWMDPVTGEPIVPPPPASAHKLMKPDVVLVTYEGLRTPEFLQLTKTGTRHFKWSCVIVDECQKVKGGRSSLLLQLLSQIKRDLMILLTGTPVQNTTQELFPMLTLVHPTRFFFDETKETRNGGGWSAMRFEERFSQIQEREDCVQLTEELHQLMAPYILRREKSHVLKTLPAKTVKLVKIPLTLIQKRVYSALYHKSIRMKGLRFTNIHMQLRKCCIHPYLIEGMEDLILDGKIGTLMDDTGTEDGHHDINSAVPNPPTEAKDPSPPNSDGLSDSEPPPERARKLILDSSGKFVLLKKMLEAFKNQNRKVLVFSFFKSALDLVEDFLHLYNYSWSLERVDGQTTGEERQLAIDRFNADPERFLFLCTTRAGGLGINLTSATVVIHLDSDFNPQHDLQAQARCHRIGQNKNVDVFHFIAEHTYEDYMLFTIAGKKLGLEAVLLGRLDSNKTRAKYDKQQEEKMLRKGVFAAIRDDEAACREAKEFAEKSMDEILQTKATTVSLQTEGESKMLLHSTSNDSVGEITMESSALDTSMEVTDQSQEEVVEKTNLKDNKLTDIEAMKVSVIEPPSQPATRQPMFSTAMFAPNGAPREDLGLAGLNEDAPDFWIRVAERLGPWALDEEKPRELTRADRRRGRNVNYSAFYEDLKAGRKKRRGSKSGDQTIAVSESSDSPSGKESDGGGSRRQDDGDDEVFSPTSASDGSDSDESELGEMSKDDIEVAGGTEMKARGLSIRTQPKGERKRHRELDMVGDSNRKANWNEWTALNIPPQVTRSLGEGAIPRHFIASGGFADILTSETTASDMQSALAVFELVYRCLRALKRWRTTKAGETGGLRTDDIRDADLSSPWALATTAGQKQAALATGADAIVRQSWLEALKEWRQGGIDFELHRNSVIDIYAKQILEMKRSALEAYWADHLDTLMAEMGCSKEELIKDMNQRFLNETRQLALVGHADAIRNELQRFCDELANEVLIGRHFSRDFTVKKQTWIGAEDFCIKLCFMHAMAHRYVTGRQPSLPLPSTMRWPPSLMEVNWSIITDVVKRLNRYTGGPERRRAAIHERFYNKLDARWNNEEFASHEREVLALAVANGLPAHVVAEEVPGRSLERIKKGLRCPSIVRESQKDNLLIQRPATGYDGLSPTPVVDITSRFRELCQEIYRRHEGNVPALQARPPPIATSQPSPAVHDLTDEGGPPVTSTLDVSNQPPQQSSVASGHDDDRLAKRVVVVNAIRGVLVQLGVRESEFEALRPSLMGQPLAALATLLRQLRDLPRSGRPIDAAGIAFAPSAAVAQSRAPSEQPRAVPETPGPTSGIREVSSQNSEGSDLEVVGESFVTPVRRSPGHSLPGRATPQATTTSVSSVCQLTSGPASIPIASSGVAPPSSSVSSPIASLPTPETPSGHFARSTIQPAAQQGIVEQSTLERAVAFLKLICPAPEQLSMLRRRMEQDPSFALRVVEEVTRIQQGTAS